MNICYRHLNQSNTNVVLCSLMALLVLMSFLAVYKPEMIRAVEIGNPTEEEKNVWVAKYWNWTASLNKGLFGNNFTPGECLINKSDPNVVMLMDTAEKSSGDPDYVCEISSKQGIMIPMWIAWCDNKEHPNYSGEQLTKCAREQYNLGTIISEVAVDNRPVAKLDVRMRLPPGGSLDYKINSLDNVTEFYSKGFNFIIPSGSRLEPATNELGPRLAGSHGWWVFLEPLPAGDHKIFYNIRYRSQAVGVEPPAIISNDITYLLRVGE